MMRHKQAIVAVVLLAVPSLHLLDSLLMVTLASVFILPGTSSAMSSAVGFTGFTVIWASLQRDAVTDGGDSAFIATLPFRRSQVFKRDLMVIGLMSAGWFFLLAWVCGAAVVRGAPISVALTYVALLGASITAQLAWLRGYYVLCLGSICVALLVGWVTTLMGTLLAMALGAFMLVCIPTARWTPLVTVRPWGGALKKFAGRGWFMLYMRILGHTEHGGYRQSLPVLTILTSLALIFFFTGSWLEGDRAILVVVYSVLASMFSSMGFSTLIKGDGNNAQILDVLPSFFFQRMFAMIMAVQWPAIILASLLATLAAIGDRHVWSAAIAPVGMVFLGCVQLYFFRLIPRHAIVATLATGTLFMGLGLWTAERAA